MRKIIGISAVLLILPRIVVQYMYAMYRQSKIDIHTTRYAGRNKRSIQHRTLMINNSPSADIDSWLHYLKGDLDLVGPARVSPERALSLNSDQSQRFAVAPGLIDPYKIKLASGIAYSNEMQIASDFARHANRLRRLQLVFTWLVQLIIRNNRKALAHSESFALFDVVIKNITMQKAVATIVKALDTSFSNKPIARFAFVNADCANKVYQDREYRQILNNFDAVFPDGIGIKIAAGMHGIALKENVNGTDMFPILCGQLQESDKRVYFHGASHKVIEQMVKKLRKAYPYLQIAGYSDGYSYAAKPKELCDRINQSGADLLFIAMGAPKQERWIQENADLLAVKAVIGVGGLFDFYSGSVSRAPMWFRELSIEWVWRIIQQPRDKFLRYLIGNPLFILRSMISASQIPNSPIGHRGV